MGRPQIGWRTLGSRDFMRVPSPAARTIAGVRASLGWGVMRWASVGAAARGCQPRRPEPGSRRRAGDQLDLDPGTLGQRRDADRRASRRRVGHVPPVDLVHRREVVNVDEEDRRLENVGHRPAGGARTAVRLSRTRAVWVAMSPSTSVPVEARGGPGPSRTGGRRRQWPGCTDRPRRGVVRGDRLAIHGGSGPPIGGDARLGNETVGSIRPRRRRRIVGGGLAHDRRGHDERRSIARRASEPSAGAAHDHLGLAGFGLDGYMIHKAGPEPTGRPAGR